MSVKLNIKEILSDKFFQNNTPFKSLDDLFSKAGVTVSSVDDYTALSENEYFNTFIQSNTLYAGFNDMKGKAAVYLLLGK